VKQMSCKLEKKTDRMVDGKSDDGDCDGVMCVRSGDLHKFFWNREGSCFHR